MRMQRMFDLGPKSWDGYFWRPAHQARQRLADGEEDSGETSWLDILQTTINRGADVLVAGRGGRTTTTTRTPLGPTTTTTAGRGAIQASGESMTPLLLAGVAALGLVFLMRRK